MLNQAQRSMTVYTAITASSSTQCVLNGPTRSPSASVFDSMTTTDQTECVTKDPTSTVPDRARKMRTRNGEYDER